LDFVRLQLYAADSPIKTGLPSPEKGMGENNKNYSGGPRP
jgi:hypothetical protein